MYAQACGELFGGDVGKPLGVGGMFASKSRETPTPSLGLLPPLQGLSRAEAEAGRLFTQVASAVSHAHGLGVAHRDLKLENMLFMEKESHPACARELKLIDWGLAHQHGLRGDGTVVPELLRSRCGSRSYMAPEVARV